MTTYIVTSTIQSRDRANPPADIQWYRGDNLATALVAMGQAACHDQAPQESHLPESMRFDVLSVRLDMQHEVTA